MMIDNSERAEAVRYYVHQALIEPMVEALPSAAPDPAMHSEDPAAVAEYWARRILALKDEGWVEDEIDAITSSTYGGPNPEGSVQMVRDFAELSRRELEAVCLDWAKQASLPMISVAELQQRHAVMQRGYEALISGLEAWSAAATLAR